MSRLLPLFQFRNEAGRLLTYDDGQDPQARKITEYVVDPAKWHNLPADKTTPDSILSQDIGTRTCGICGLGGVACPGKACVESFRARVSAYGDQVTEVRSAGAMGKGVFATQDIPAGTWLGEYLGEIVPSDVGLTPEQWAYTFDVGNRYAVESREFRNWTAFMNHRCEENVKAIPYVYGRRYVIAFRTNIAIANGDQMFTWYGRGYFELGEKQCLCDAIEGPHLPEEGMICIA